MAVLLVLKGLIIVPVGTMGSFLLEDNVTELRQVRRYQTVHITMVPSKIPTIYFTWVWFPLCMTMAYIRRVLGNKW